jgi:hypothetical protein
MQAIKARPVRPGNVRKVKNAPSGRRCTCGTLLSVYNRTKTCYTCS